MHDKFLTQDERYKIVEWIDIGGQWDNIQVLTSTRVILQSRIRSKLPVRGGGVSRH